MALKTRFQAVLHGIAILGYMRFSTPRYSVRRTVALITCLFVVTAPLLATAQERSLSPAQETRLVELIESGKAAYDRGDFAQAREEFGQAYDLYPHPDLLYRIALCHERLGEDRLAVEFYRRFLAEAPDAPERARVEKTIEVIEARIARSEIRVTSDPEGAAVFINDEANGAAGYTPTALAVSPGNYKLIVKKPGFEMVDELVTVSSGSSVSVRYQLTPVKAAEPAQVGQPDARATASRRGPSVQLVTLLALGVGSGVASLVFFKNYNARKEDIDAKPRSEFTRAEFESLQSRANINLVAGISTASISAFSLIWAYGLWRRESLAAASLLAPSWSDGPALTWRVQF